MLPEIAENFDMDNKYIYIRIPQIMVGTVYVNMLKLQKLLKMLKLSTNRNMYHNVSLSIGANIDISIINSVNNL